ncbi:MAG: DUF2188 domain-containing protein [Minisyncoccota bacterium]
MAKNIHTVYNSDRERWENKREGSATPLSSHHTKDNALDAGERVAKDRSVEHFIHGKDGKIQQRNSYGNDPFPPRG